MYYIIGVIVIVDLHLVPGQGPKTDIGSFDIKNTFHSRDVTVYWQQIPKELENGNNFHYRIIHIEQNGKK